MSKLQFAGRWITFTPEWLGNKEEEAPFSVRFRRLTIAEVANLKQAWIDLLTASKGVASPDELAALFGGNLQGPHGELEVDGEAIAAGNLGALLAIAARENLWLDCLARELAENLVAVNQMSNEAEGKFERRPGGTGTSSDLVAAPHESTTDLQPDAPAAAP